MIVEIIKMNKNDIIKEITKKTLSYNQAKDIVDTVFEIIKKEIFENSNKVVISNFGTFEPKITKPRIARNPKTNEKVPVSSKKTIKFKISKNL